MKTVKLLFLFTLSLSLGSIFSFAQLADKDANKSKPKKFEDFHSNLGQQGIVELRDSPRRGLPVKTRSRSSFRAYRKPSVQSNGFARRGGDGTRSAFIHEKRWSRDEPGEEKKPSAVSASVFAGGRPYQTNNDPLAVG